MKCKSKLTVATTAVALALMGSAAVYAQDKYALVTTSGIAFSDFRGYEDWAVVSSARTDEVLKVIVANPTMIAAYKAGVPGNGQPFPDGSKIAKLQWNPKKSAEAPFVVDVPDQFKQAFVMEKDSKRFPNSGGWGYALFNYQPASDTFTADPSPADCGHACHVVVKAKDHIFHPYEKRRTARSKMDQPSFIARSPPDATGCHGFETLHVRKDGGVLFVDIAAPPMNLLGPELVRNLVLLIQEAEGDNAIKVLVFTSADPDYFIPHVDVTRIGSGKDLV